MSAKENLLYSYLIPILFTLLLLVTSVLLGLANIANLLLASALFVIIGFSVFFAELLIARASRDTDRRGIYTLITNLLFRNGVTTGAGNLINQDEIFAIEASADEIWIYAYDLAWEGEGSKFPDLVLNNLKRGAKYRYIVPNNKQVESRVNTLRHKYSSVKDLETLIKFKSRQRDLKLVQFGIGIYNPSLLSKGTRPVSDCIAVFYPHYSAYGPKNENPKFVTLRGQSTIELQEGFYELWNEAIDVPPAQGKDI